MTEEKSVTPKRAMRGIKALKGAQTADALIPTMQSSPVPNSATEVRPTETIQKELCNVMGVQGSEVAKVLISEVVLIQKCSLDWLKDERADLTERAFESIREMQPANAMEAMLATQMIGVHNVAIKLLAASMTTQTLEGLNAKLLWATRLMRLFNEQLEAMAKLKGKTGQQRVVVEHVNVNAGGQAIVGAVTAGKPEPGGKD